MGWDYAIGNDKPKRKILTALKRDLAKVGSLDLDRDPVERALEGVSGGREHHLLLDLRVIGGPDRRDQ